MSEYAARIAAQIRAQMALRGITQTELARGVGMSQPAISRRLSGAVPFDLVELELVAAYLDLPPGSLGGADAA